MGIPSILTSEGSILKALFKIGFSPLPLIINLISEEKYSISVNFSFVIKIFKIMSIYIDNSMLLIINYN